MLDPDSEAELPDDSPPPLPVVQAIRQLIDDAQASAQSEFALWSAAGAVAAAQLRAITVWGIVALMGTFVALLGFVVGAILALSQWVGAVGAALLVPGIVLATAAFAALRARRAALHLRDTVKAVKA